MAVHANHCDICRFESAEDPNYRPVWIRIEDFVTEAMEKIQKKDAMESCTSLLLRYRGFCADA